MVIINSKRLHALKKENDELRAFVQKMSDKHSTISSLDETIKKIRAEMSGLQEQQQSYVNSIDRLKESEKTALLELEKLNKELNNLRELKAEEQNSITFLSDQISRSTGSNVRDHKKSKEKTYSEDSKENSINLGDAERKKNELRRETNELENKLKDLYNRIVDLTDQEQTLLLSIDKQSKQLDAIESCRLIDAKAELDEIESKISNVKRIEKKSIEEFQQRIKTLSQKEKELQDKVSLKFREVEKIQEKAPENIFHIQKYPNQKIPELIAEEQKPINSNESKRNELNDSNSVIISFQEEKSSTNKSENSEIPSSEVSLQKNIQSVIRNLEKEAAKLREHINQLKMTEELKRELIGKLKDDLSGKEIELAAVENDIKIKSNQFKEVSIKNQQLAEEIEFKNNKLAKLNSSLNDKKNHFDQLEKNISELEESIAKLNDELAQRDKVKTETNNKISSGKEALNALKLRAETVRKNILNLDLKQKEIKENNKLFEERFVKLFEKYSEDVNDMNNKRNVLEHMLKKKEEDIEEKDNTLAEKIALLDETEKVLLLRQKDIDSLDDLLKIIKDQRELLKGDIQNLDAKAAEKKLENEELKIESDVLRGKISEFDKGLLGLLNSAEERLKKSTERREKLDGEIKEYEIRLGELNNDIKDSMNELVNLQDAIGKIKVEHEEHRLEINKLASLKNKLYDEINKSRIILDKYKKIRERIRIERDSILKQREEKLKKDFKSHAIPPATSGLPDLTKMFKL